MTLTAEQSRALVDAIAAAPSSAAPADLRLEARRRWGGDLPGSFLELLIELRAIKLAGVASNGERDPTALVGEMLEALEHRARPAPPRVS